MLGQFSLALQELGWDANDELSVEIGGVAVTGTATHPDANPKWAKPFGTVSYQNDASQLQLISMNISTAFLAVYVQYTTELRAIYS